MKRIAGSWLILICCFTACSGASPAVDADTGEVSQTDGLDSIQRWDGLRLDSSEDSVEASHGLDLVAEDGPADSAPDAPTDGNGDDGEQAPLDPYEGMTPRGVALGDFLGIASHLPRDLGDNFQREFELDRMQEAGVTHLRKTFRWEHMEPLDDAYWFDEYNLVIDECAAHGMDVMVGFRGKPDWATTDGTHDTLDTSKWAEFLGVFADEVGPRVRLYEIWNEPNLDVFWDPAPNPGKYGELLQAAYDAIHQHDDDALVLLGGLSPFQFNELGVWGFLSQTFETHPDLCAHFDALAIHPYSFLQMLPPEEGAEFMGVYQPGMVGMIEEAREILAAHGCADKPIHLTEAGWPDLYIGLETQAAYLVRGIVLALSAGAESWYRYTFWDGEITPTTDIPSEERFGFFTWPNDETTQAKPVYLAYQVLGTQWKDFRFAGNLSAALGWEESLHALAFRDNTNRWLLALWKESGDGGLEEKALVEIPFPKGTEGPWELTDLAGQSLESGEVSPNGLALELDGRIRWLSFAALVLE